MVRYSKDDILTREELDDLINACEKPKETLVIVGLAFTGMRASEFAHFRESWINWQKDVINVPEHQGDWHPKTKAGAREIFIVEPQLRRVLRDWFMKHETIGMTRVSIHDTVRRVAARVKILKKVYPHCLRATFATMLAEKGVEPANIQVIMGWAKLSTADSYVKPRRAMEDIRAKW